jgi:hypothetical protein
MTSPTRLARSAGAFDQLTEGVRTPDHDRLAPAAVDA